MQVHKTALTRQYIENTEVITSCKDNRRHPIIEALYIKNLEPNLNLRNLDMQALPSMKRWENTPACSQSEAELTVLSRQPTVSQITTTSIATEEWSNTRNRDLAMIPYGEIMSSILTK
ncbi:hypothetical protein E2C01_030740 [Portunus trituberculatus]|uniref:Uncharacterized protein n=1 Tax=Portunus trituberculatus TaxID=210409 RepID=A0A5B7EVQ0_PORTR|nr:hypothetical protein [Portunus trituberculatus]